MKRQKTFFWVICLLVVVVSVAIGMTACSTQDDPLNMEVAHNSDYEALNSALDNYTTSFFKKNESSVKSRSWKHFWTSVKADYAGLSATGGTVFCISTSRKKWKELRMQEQQDSIQAALTPAQVRMINNEIIRLHILYQSEGSIGALHNMAILNLLLKDKFEYSTTQELVESTKNSLASLGVNVANVDVAKTVQKVDKFFEEDYSDDTNVMYDRLIAKYPAKKEELKVLKGYIANVQQLNTQQDIKNFTEGYLAIIRGAAIPVSSINSIESNIQLAPASYELWEQIDGYMNQE